MNDTPGSAGVSPADPTRRRERPLTQEEVLRRNSVERLKVEKHPYDVLNDLPRFIEIPYEEIPEDDILRLQWYGLYHDKPKVGDFMLRVKVPNGTLTPAQLRTVGRISREHGENSGELTTRQDIQVHYVRLASLPQVLAELSAAGLTTTGGCGDNLRNMHVDPVRGRSIACTGDPHCNFAVGPTKPKLEEIVTHLEGRFGERIADLRIYLDGCPHACGQHWVGDLGFQGTTRNSETGKIISYDIILRGKLGPGAAIGRPLLRRVPSEQVNAQVERLVGAWIEVGEMARASRSSIAASRTSRSWRSRPVRDSNVTPQRRRGRGEEPVSCPRWSWLDFV